MPFSVSSSVCYTSVPLFMVVNINSLVNARRIRRGRGGEGGKGKGERGVATIWKDPVIRLMRGLGTRGSPDGDTLLFPPFVRSRDTPLSLGYTGTKVQRDFPDFLAAEKGYLPCPKDLLSSSFSMQRCVPEAQATTLTSTAAGRPAASDQTASP